MSDIPNDYRCCGRYICYSSRYRKLIISRMIGYDNWLRTDGEWQASISRGACTSPLQFFPSPFNPQRPNNPHPHPHLLPFHSISFTETKPYPYPYPQSMLPAPIPPQPTNQPTKKKTSKITQSPPPYPPFSRPPITHKPKQARYHPDPKHPYITHSSPLLGTPASYSLS